MHASARTTAPPARGRRAVRPVRPGPGTCSASGGQCSSGAQQEDARTESAPVDKAVRKIAESTATTPAGTTAIDSARFEAPPRWASRTPPLASLSGARFEANPVRLGDLVLSSLFVGRIGGAELLDCRRCPRLTAQPRRQLPDRRRSTGDERRSRQAPRSATLRACLPAGAPEPGRERGRPPQHNGG